MSRFSKFLLLLALCSVCLTGCKAKDTAAEEQPAAEQADTVTPQIVVQPEEAAQPSEQAEPQSKPVQIEQPQAAAATELQQKADTLQQTAAQIGGTWSIGVIAPGQSSCVAANSQAMQSASLIKLYVAACVERDRTKLQAQEQYAGENDTLLLHMLSQSDNDATNTLTRRLGSGDAAAGMAVVNAYCKEQGYTDTSMGRLMLDFSATTDNYTSVRDCCMFLRAVLDGSVPGSDAILAALKQQERTGKSPAGVPSGVQTANKTGELDTVENDAAIIWKGNEPYILCVMSGSLTSPGAAREQITQISSEMYSYFAE